jgi:rhamnosyltransferase
MLANKVCAIVVSYHPQPDIIENLLGIRSQVSNLVVIDNGSSIRELIILRDASRSLGFELIENVRNEGLARALNRGVNRAAALNCRWLVFFDQDSTAASDFVKNMLTAYTRSEWAEQLGILVPKYIDALSGQAFRGARRTNIGGLEEAMTSGSFFKLRTFQKYGVFVEDLFIDGIDTEYSLRLRKAGLVIEECSNAFVMHTVGAPSSFLLFGKISITTRNYSAIRRYYQERNRIWLLRRYFTTFPIWFLRLYVFTLKEVVKLSLLEKQRMRKLYFIGRGIADGLLGMAGRSFLE